MFEHDGILWSGGGFMWLFWVLLVVAILLALKFVLGGDSIASSSEADESAMSILKKRYARGEIDDEEFKRRCKALEKS